MGYVADRLGDCKLTTPAWADDVFPYLSTLAGGSKGPLTLCFGRTFNAAGEYNCDNKPQNQSLLSAYFDDREQSDQAYDRWVRHTSVISALAAQPSINCLESPPATPPVATLPSPPPAPHCSGRVPKDAETCQAVAEYLGLGLGGYNYLSGDPTDPIPFTFVRFGALNEKGCFAFPPCVTSPDGTLLSGRPGLCGNAFFGTGGSDAEMETYLFRGVEGDAYTGPRNMYRYRLTCPPSSDYGFDSAPPSPPPSPPFCGFTVLPLEKTAAEAITECEALGAQPAKISNAYENAMLLHELRAVAERENIPVQSAWLGAREFMGDRLEGAFYWIADGTVLDDPNVFRFWDRYPSSCEDRAPYENDIESRANMCLGNPDAGYNPDGESAAERIALLKLSGRCDDVPDHRCPTHPTCRCAYEAYSDGRNSFERYQCARECVANATRRTRVTYGPRITSFSNWKQSGNTGKENNGVDGPYPGTQKYVFFEDTGCSRSSEESAPGPMAWACVV